MEPIRKARNRTRLVTSKPARPAAGSPLKPPASPLALCIFPSSRRDGGSPPDRNAARRLRRHQGRPEDFLRHSEARRRMKHGGRGGHGGETSAAALEQGSPRPPC